MSERALPAELVELRDVWSDLAERSGNVFLTWEWAKAWWQVYGRGREPVIGRVRSESGEIVALIPLQRRGRPVRTLRFVGAEVSDQTGVICAPATLPVAAAELRRLVADTPHDVFLAERLPGGENWAELLGSAPVLREESPDVRLETDDWDAFLAGRSSNFRQQMRRFERRLVRDHAMKIREPRDARELARDLDLVFDLHALRWGPGTTEFQGPKARAFHHAFAPLALERGWLRLLVAELDGRPAAVWYGFRFGGAEWFYQQGRDPALEKTSVGTVLTACALREAIGAGMKTYKFLLGGEEYKKRFATDDQGLDSFVAPRTAAGRLGMLAARGSYRLPPRAATQLRAAIL